MRYYYLCQIKAEFMKKYHGMDYEILYYGGSTISGFFLNEASVKLLEPQVGDVGVDELNSPGEWQERNDGWAFRTDEGLPLYNCKIIWRNGLPFMWPETENPMPKEGV